MEIKEFLKETGGAYTFIRSNKLNENDLCVYDEICTIKINEVNKEYRLLIEWSFYVDEDGIDYDFNSLDDLLDHVIEGKTIRQYISDLTNEEADTRYLIDSRVEVDECGNILFEGDYKVYGNINEFKKLLQQQKQALYKNPNNLDHPLSFEEAFKIAKENLDIINACDEFVNGYHFYETSDEQLTGGDEGLFVGKDGKLSGTMVIFIEHNKPGEIIKHYNLDYVSEDLGMELKNKLKELVKNYPDVLKDNDYCVEMMDKVKAEGKDVDLCIEYFDSCLNDLCANKDLKDLNKLQALVNDDELLAKALKQHLDLRSIKEALQVDYDEALKVIDKNLPKA